MNQMNELTNHHNNDYFQPNLDENVTNNMSYIQPNLDENDTNVFNNLNSMNFTEIWKMMLELEAHQDEMAMEEVILQHQENERNIQLHEEMMIERRRLYSLGLYELEDGEILD